MKPRMKAILFIGVLVLLGHLSYAQAEPKWMQDFRAPKSLRTCRALETPDGKIAVIGSVPGWVYFTLLDEEGGVIQKNSLEMEKACVLSALATETGYFLAGYQEESGKSFPVLWRMDKSGQRILPVFSGGKHYLGRFTDLTRNLAGELLATGQAKGQMCFGRFDGEGRLQDSLLVTHKLGGASGQALAVNAFGDVFITGSIKKSGASFQQVWKFTSQGQLFWEKTFGPPLAEGVDITVMDNGDLVAGGKVYSKPYEPGSYLFRFSPNGRLVWESLHTSEDSRQPVAILQTPNRDILIGGEISSFGARTGDAWLHWVDRDSGRPMQVWRKGGHLSDIVTDILRLRNGDYLVVILSGELVQLLYYQSGANLCRTRLSTDQKALFAPLLENELALGEKAYTFRAMILASEPLKEWNILVKNQALGIKAPLGPGSISLEERPTFDGQHCYYLEKTLWLEPGINQIQTSIRAPEVLLHDTLTIYSLPKRPNLHLLSIGIVYGDLNFTDEDARDFAEIFQEQEGRLYEKVLTTVLNTKEETAAYRIVDKILEMKDKADTILAIRPEDVLIVFISSHGDVAAGDGAFILPGSDYRPDNDRTYIRFQKEILDVLEKLECKKILFIDACKSGGAKGEAPLNSILAKSILQSANAAPGVTTISSSAGDQFSYEHNQLKNGLFTAAIKEGLTTGVGEVDINGDRIISLGELNSFLQSRVPELLWEYYGDPNKRQTPVMPRNDLPEDFPVYFINY